VSVEAVVDLVEGMVVDVVVVDVVVDVVVVDVVVVGSVEAVVVGSVEALAVDVVELVAGAGDDAAVLRLPTVRKIPAAMTFKRKDGRNGCRR
jgi:hypothetical protein